MLCVLFRKFTEKGFCFVINNKEIRNRGLWVDLVSPIRSLSEIGKYFRADLLEAEELHHIRDVRLQFHCKQIPKIVCKRDKDNEF